jgi:hypothetical protein
MSQPRKVFSFAKMMVLAQRRHDSRQAAAQEEDFVTSPTPAQRDEQARRAPEKVDSARFAPQITEQALIPSLSSPVLAESGRSRI